MGRIFAVTVLLVLGGCASSNMDVAECQTADWRAVGQEDGSRGSDADSFGLRSKACAGHGVAANVDDYMVGYAQGIETFCQPRNAYRLGRGGHRYTGVCPEHLERAFLAAHADGYGLYERQHTLNSISRLLETKRARSEEIEDLVSDKTTLLASPSLPPSERTALAVELKQLASEKTQVERLIGRFERDYEEAERDYQSYRGQIANRY